MEFIIIWAMFGALAGFIAAQKGHSGLTWFLIGIVGGIFAVVASMFLKQKD
jgi:uncharacterized membrane protein YeaQ/YmgE (transglycosylase-associated protein family)